MISIKETSSLKKELISKAQERHKKAKSFKQFRKDANRTPLKKGEVRKLVNGKWVSNKKEEVEHKTLNVEAKVDDGKSREEKEKARNKRAGMDKTPVGALPRLDPNMDRRDDHEDKRGVKKVKGEKEKKSPLADLFGEAKTAAWQRKEGKNKKGGLNEKGRKSYERENPGSDLKAPQPGGGPRKRSFCARMGGVKGPMKKPDGSPTRKALALRKWKC